ncbi:MAG: hypothetical protein ACKOC1_08490 [Hyphomicrobiales bacterium]
MQRNRLALTVREWPGLRVTMHFVRKDARSNVDTHPPSIYIIIAAMQELSTETPQETNRHENDH